MVLGFGQICSFGWDTTHAATAHRQDFVLTSLHRPILPRIDPRVVRKQRNKFSRRSGGNSALTPARCCCTYSMQFLSI
jgi:hypothetical protein